MKQNYVDGEEVAGLCLANGERDALLVVGHLDCDWH